MCDTLAIRDGGAVWFAKNSDREPDEPQHVERHAPVRGDKAATLRCTHIEIAQVPNRRGVIISRPAWMWGAEMGVNDAGVAIGNEAVFGKSVLKRGAALLGMDLVRLGLERAVSAAEACEAIVTLLETHGQGGPAGYRNKAFRYDNSFLIADGREIWKLETAGREWALQRLRDRAVISNTYTITDDFHRASAPPPGGDFKTAHEAFFMPRLACAAARIALNEAGLDEGAGAISLGRLAALMRRHAKGDGFSGGSNRDVCMHARPPLRPSATTASMIVRLKPAHPPLAAFTATPAPCLSLFKPAGFSGAWAALDESLWARGEALRAHAARDKAFRAAVRESLAGAEAAVFAGMEGDDLSAAEAAARDWTRRWL